MKVCKIEKFLSYIDFLNDPKRDVKEKIEKIKEFRGLKTNEDVEKVIISELFCLDKRNLRKLLNELFKMMGVDKDKRKERIVEVFEAQKKNWFS